jgi:hypothetical protein
LREEHRPRVFENRVLRRIFGLKREEDGSWRKLHNDELHCLYSSPNTARVEFRRITEEDCRGGQGISWAVEPRRERERERG